jgi:hypothetical protein
MDAWGAALRGRGWRERLGVQAAGVVSRALENLPNSVAPLPAGKLIFSGEKLDRTAQSWGGLSEAIALRNKLTNPKEPQKITADNVKRAIQSIIAAINALFQAIYKKPLPAANLGLQSRVLF